MKKIMFDTNAFDKVLDKELPLKLIEKSISKGYKYFITHIQTDELSNIPDEKNERRSVLLLYLMSVSPALVPTSSFVLGHSRLGFGKLGSPGYYGKLLNPSKNNINDAIIGDTAIDNDMILITHDPRLQKKVLSLGGQAQSIDKFKQTLLEETGEIS